MAKFAGYGFNKPHAAAYALITYQTAYLKANYPVEFLAASMTLDLGNTDKLHHFRQELDRLGIRLLPPDINRSEPAFTGQPDPKTGKPAIRYALAAVKGVGAQAMAELSDRARAVVTLAYHEGLTHHEIAQRTALPLGTVKSDLRRSLERMRRALEPGDA